MPNEFKNKIILVTGGTGTVGSALVRALLAYQPKQVRVFSRDQNKQYDLLEELDRPKNLRLLIGDIRDERRLDLALENVDIVFHAAALKHVPLCEYNPFEAIKTNIVGSQNVIEAARRHGVKKVIAISTDKAVNPTSVMGTSKLMMEQLFINANHYRGTTQARFACVRFGNVAWASGSVLSLWKRQLEKSGSIKITDENMTRFLMSKEQAANLVLKATELTRGGEVFVFKMPAIRLGDLAALFLKKHAPDRNIKINVIGNRGREKQHEELFHANNGHQRVFENKDMYIIVPPSLEYLTWDKRSYPSFKKINQTGIKLASHEHINEKAIHELI